MGEATGATECANVIDTGPRLDMAAMPIIEFMALCPMSWQSRLLAADALRRVVQHWKSMESERELFRQRAAEGQQASGGDQP